MKTIKSHDLLKVAMIGLMACLYWNNVHGAVDVYGCELIDSSFDPEMKQAYNPPSLPRICRDIINTELERSYILCIPPTLRAQTPPNQQPVALVLAFHGAGENSSGESFRSKVQFEVKGVVDGFITAYPNGCSAARTGNGNDIEITCDGGNWNAPGDGNPVRGFSERCQVDDIGFVSKVITSIKKIYSNVESDKVFAFGHSKGGIFAYSLACNMPSILSAIGVTSATQTDVNCAATSATGYPAVFHVHNLQDINVPFLGGGDNSWPPAEDGLQFWAARHGCTLPIDYHDFGQTMCLEADCQIKSVELCLVGMDILEGLGDDPTNPASPHRYETYDGAFEIHQFKNIRDYFVDKYFE